MLFRSNFRGPRTRAASAVLERELAKVRLCDLQDLLLAGLPEAGFDRFAPAEGAFYLYCDVAHLTNDSRDFCKRMLAETGVATTHGIDFDRARGAGTLRISFAGSTAEMEEAVRRLKAWRRA